MRKPLAHTALFMVGLLGTAALIRTIDPLPFWSYGRRKVAHLAEHLDDYDTLFFGSSRVVNGIVPGVFDARMAQLGRSSRSFNAAVAASKPHDFDNVIDWVLAQDPQRLRRVFIELHSYEQVIADGQSMTDLVIEAHTPATFWPRVQSVMISHRTGRQKLQQVWDIAQHTIVNGLRIGQGPRIARDLLDRWRALPPAGYGPMSHAGFVEIGPEKAAEERLRTHREWVSAPAEAADMLDAKRAELVPQRLHGGFNFAAFHAQRNRLLQAGIEVNYIVMPNYSNWFRGRDALDELRETACILELDRPLDFAPLFTFELWFDASHVLRPGAYAISFVLADEYDKAHDR